MRARRSGRAQGTLVPRIPSLSYRGISCRVAYACRSRQFACPHRHVVCYWPAGTTGPDSITPHAMRDPASPVASVAGSGPATITGGSLDSEPAGALGATPGAALAIGEAVGAGAWYRSGMLA